MPIYINLSFNYSFKMLFSFFARFSINWYEKYNRYHGNRQSLQDTNRLTLKPHEHSCTPEFVGVTRAPIDPRNGVGPPPDLGPPVAPENARRVSFIGAPRPQGF